MFVKCSVSGCCNVSMLIKTKELYETVTNRANIMVKMFYVCHLHPYIFTYVWMFFLVTDTKRLPMIFKWNPELLEARTLNFLLPVTGYLLK